MPDVVTVLVDSFVANWQIVTIAFLFFTSVLPWVILAGMNFLNHNIWAEITAVLDRKRVKLLMFLQNGTYCIMYRKITGERKIVLKEDKKGGHSEFITPTTSPVHDSNSHKQLYLAVEGVEGTFNPLAETSYDVNTPMRKMGHTMSFEAGREFERTFNTKDSLFNLATIVQIAIPTIVLIVMLIFVFTQASTLGNIKETLVIMGTQLDTIAQHLSSSYFLGAGNAVTVAGG